MIAVITGDIVAERWGILDLKKRDQKEQAERKGIRKIFDKIGDSDTYIAIFDEMLVKSTAEAKVFRQIDKLEMVFQALEYEKEQGKNLEEFFADASLHMKDDIMKKIFKDILKSRKKEYQKSLEKKLRGKI